MWLIEPSIGGLLLSRSSPLKKTSHLLPAPFHRAKVDHFPGKRADARLTGSAHSIFLPSFLMFGKFLQFTQQAYTKVPEFFEISRCHSILRDQWILCEIAPCRVFRTFHPNSEFLQCLVNFYNLPDKSIQKYQNFSASRNVFPSA